MQFFLKDVLIYWRHILLYISDRYTENLILSVDMHFVP
jgi:hypothetical protein